MRLIRFGGQVDTQVINESATASNEALTSSSVAGYIAKYATKAAESTGSTPRPIKRRRDISRLGLNEHATRMIETCFDISTTSGFEHINPYRTAHMLGYGGHCTTKSRRYSTTFGTLRGNRREHQEAERRGRLGLPSLDGRDLVVESDWTYVRSGLSYGEEQLVAGIRDRLRLVRSARPNSVRSG